MTSFHDPNLTDREAYTKLMQDEKALAALNQKDPIRYRDLHEQVLHYLNAQLLAGNQEIEPDWTAVYERLGDLYVARDTTALLQMTAEAEKIPLQNPESQHIRQFFRGIAYLRQAHYAIALETFSDLLTAPQLNKTLRARTLNAQAVINRVTGKPEAAMAGYVASLELWQELGDIHYQGIVDSINLQK